MVGLDLGSLRILRRALAALAVVIAMAWFSPAVSAPAKAQGPPGDSLFVRASVENDRPYLGQQITYKFKVYQNSGGTVSSTQVRYKPPGFAGFWNSYPVEQDKYPETIDSAERQVIELRTILFPSVVGTAVIDPAGLAVSTGSTGDQILLEGPPIAIEVRSLPAGSPAGFTGAVGRFEISAEADAAQGQVNEPVQVMVTVSGEGNIEALPEPSWPEFSGWRVIESPAGASTRVVAGQVTGHRTFKITLVPERAGELAIPEIGFTHFDPDSERFVQVATAPIVISVAGSDGQAAAPALPDISGDEEQAETEMRPIKAVPLPLRRSGKELTGNTAYWAAWGLPLLAVVGALAWRRRQSALESARAASLRLNALPDARSFLARDVASGIDPRIAAAGAVMSYLSARLETPLAGLTRETLLRRLRESGASSGLTDRVEAVLSAGETARYIPAQGNTGRGQGYADDIAQLLADLEEVIGE